MSKRSEFLAAFLGALGAVEVVVARTTPEFVAGVVIYDVVDPEERQEFLWHVSEAEVPDDDVLRLAALLRDQSLLDIDRITVSRASLRDLFVATYKKPVSEERFRTIVEDLESVRVPMVDDGKEGDWYFIHE